MTSLADVSFTLMIIFLIAGVSTALTRRQGVDLDLPRTSTVRPQTRRGLTVSIRSDGRVFVGRRATDRKGFARVFGEELSRSDYSRVYLRADRRVDYGLVMEILGEVREQGVTDIGLVALPKR